MKQAIIYILIFFTFGISAQGRGIENFENDSFGLWTINPETIGNKASWEIIKSNEEGAVINTPTNSQDEISWRLIRQIDLYVGEPGEWEKNRMLN